MLFGAHDTIYTNDRTIVLLPIQCWDETRRNESFDNDGKIDNGIEMNSRYNYMPKDKDKETGGWASTSRRAIAVLGHTAQWDCLCFLVLCPEKGGKRVAGSSYLSCCTSVFSQYVWFTGVCKLDFGWMGLANRWRDLRQWECDGHSSMAHIWSTLGKGIDSNCLNWRGERECIGTEKESLHLKFYFHFASRVKRLVVHYLYTPLLGIFFPLF